MRLRIPEWAHGASASVNSGPVVPLIPGVFVTIHRQWKTGDRVELHLPMTISRPLKMLPFTAIGDEQYSTYLRVE